MTLIAPLPPNVKAPDLVTLAPAGNTIVAPVLMVMVLLNVTFLKVNVPPVKDPVVPFNSPDAPVSLIVPPVTLIAPDPLNCTERLITPDERVLVVQVTVPWGV